MIIFENKNSDNTFVLGDVSTFKSIKDYWLIIQLCSLLNVTSVDEKEIVKELHKNIKTNQ